MLNLPAVDLFSLQSDVRVPDFPANESKGSHVVPFTRTIFIEQSDFREVRERQNKSNEPSISSRLFFALFWDCGKKMMDSSPFCRRWRRATSV